MTMRRRFLRLLRILAIGAVLGNSVVTEANEVGLQLAVDRDAGYQLATTPGEIADRNSVGYGFEDIERVIEELYGSSRSEVSRDERLGFPGGVFSLRLAKFEDLDAIVLTWTDGTPPFEVWRAGLPSSFMEITPSGGIPSPQWVDFGVLNDGNDYLYLVGGSALADGLRNGLRLEFPREATSVDSQNKRGSRRCRSRDHPR